MDAFSILQFAAVCIMFCLLSPVLPCLALKPRLRSRSFPARILIGTVTGDLIMVIPTVWVLWVRGGTVMLDLVLILIYAGMAIVAYQKHPWVLFTQFAKYSRRILLGVMGWKTVLRNLFEWLRDKLLVPDSYGDRTFRKHSGEWLLVLAFVFCGAALFCLRRWDIYGLSDSLEKEIMEHGISAAQGHPFRGSALTFFPAMMCDCVAVVTRIEGYAVIRTWSFVLFMQLSSVVAGALILLDRKRTFGSLMVAFLSGLVLIAFFPERTMEVPDNDTAKAMFSIRLGNPDHSWSMIAVDDSLGIARVYGRYYSALSLLEELQNEAAAEEPLTSRRAGDIFLHTEKIYVCVDHDLVTENASRNERLRVRAQSLMAWAEELERIYPQNVELVSDTDQCTVFLIRQDPENPLNLSVDSTGSGTQLLSQDSSDSGRTVTERSAEGEDA